MSLFLYHLYLAMVLLRPTDRFPAVAALPVMSATAGLALAVAGLRVLTGRGPTWRSAQVYLVVAFLAWAMFSLVAADRWLGGASVVFRELLPGITLFFLTVLNLDSTRRVRATAYLLVALCLVITVEAVAAFHYGYGGKRFLMRQGASEETGGEEDSFETVGDGEIVRVRSLGELNDPNDLAQALVTVLPLAFFAWRRGRWLRNAALVWGPVTLMLYGVYLTRSRGGLLALIVVVFVALQRRLGHVFSLAASGLGGAALLAFGFVGRRSMGMDASALGRIDGWSEGLQMLKASPIWGVGYGNFTDLHRLVAHNSFVHCFAELGLVGYFIWLGTLVLTLLQGFALARRTGSEELPGYARLGLYSLVGFLAGALFLSRTYSTVLFLILAFVTAIIDLGRRAGLLERGTTLAGWLMLVSLIEIVSIAMVYVSVQFVY